MGSKTPSVPLFSDMNQLKKFREVIKVTISIPNSHLQVVVLSVSSASYMTCLLPLQVAYSASYAGDLGSSMDFGFSFWILS